MFSFSLFLSFSFILHFTIPGYQSRGADGDGRIDAGVFLENFLLFLPGRFLIFSRPYSFFFFENKSTPTHRETVQFNIYTCRHTEMSVA